MSTENKENIDDKIKLVKLDIGLTGYMGSGKTTAAEYFGELGAKIVDVDKIAHKIYKKDYEQGEKLYCTILKLFYDDNLLDETGEINRKVLGNTVFNNPKKLDLLNKLVWPYIETEISEIKEVSNGITIYDAALLFEANWYKLMDFSILVNADEKVRFERIKQRNGNLSKDEIIVRMNAQTMPLSQKIELSKYIIDNNGNLQNLKSEVKRVWEEILSKYKITPKKA